jgi:hypothetical protein
MFEITADDIARLNDEILRAVIARLCEAEVRQRGYSAAAVTWGGNQNAPDGGIDVRVALSPGSIIDGFIPRPMTGFQIKHEDLSASEVVAEMRPKGVLRASIEELAQHGGAYVIVSAQGSTADTALSSRRNAMRDAVAGVSNADALVLDFFDRTRVATWLRTHEGLVPWVRALAGRAMQGWQSYGPWAPESDREYLVDDKLRLHYPRQDAPGGLSIIDGIHALRHELHQAQHVVRLVGLSGMGKTRLVQALFDERVGTDSVDGALAIYTNMMDDPDPPPVHVASRLVTGSVRAALIIDNCPAGLHERLAQVCSQPASKLSVLTVEYDIRDDEPEGTTVFRLDTASPKLIERLVQQRFPTVSPIDARTIAEFSGGNARIAITLASTIGHRETIAGLTNDELFRRLVQQRHDPNEALVRAAQVCALVYSFHGEDVGPESELARLGALVGQTPQDLYAHVAELERRDLVQRRGVWRAVLPHAIATEFAATALRNIPYAAIRDKLFPSGRLLRSFSRRIGFLHASTAAKSIVQHWLAVGGLIGDVAQLNDLSKSIFRNVAPVLPEPTLAALERAYTEQPRAGMEYVDLLALLAYDPPLFERCTRLIALILRDEHEERSQGRVRFGALFHLYLSGTCATIEQRLTVVSALLTSLEAPERALGLVALNAVLEAWQFQAANTFDLGHTRAISGTGRSAATRFSRGFVRRSR